MANTNGRIGNIAMLATGSGSSKKLHSNVCFFNFHHKSHGKIPPARKPGGKRYRCPPEPGTPITNTQRIDDLNKNKGKRD
jgi:hypothetical protein